MAQLKTYTSFLIIRPFIYSVLSVFIYFMVPVVSVFAQTGTVTDIDEITYQTLKIGEQWWMAENLRVTRYNNGDAIPFLIIPEEWAATKTPAFGYFANDTSNIKKFGLLYNWFTVDDKREICPDGWHVPSDQEWIQMEKALGMSTQESEKMTAWRGTIEGNKLKSAVFGGNNSTGFSAVGTGYRHPTGSYKGQGTDNDYWTSTVYYNAGIREGVLHGLLNNKTTIVRNHHTADYGFCIRCVKNEITGAGIKTEPKINIYPNPASDKLFIENATDKVLSIYTIKGSIILKQKINSSLFCTDISSLKHGTYIVRIEGNDIQLYNLIIKK